MESSESLKDIESMLDRQQLEEQQDSDVTAATGVEQPVEETAAERKKREKEERRRQYAAAFADRKETGDIKQRKKLSKAERRQLQESQKREKEEKSSMKQQRAAVSTTNTAASSTKGAVSTAPTSPAFNRRRMIGNTRYSSSWNLFDHLPAFTRLSVSSYCRSLSANVSVSNAVAAGAADTVDECMNEKAAAASVAGGASSGAVRLHPALVQLALQIQHGVISGSNARCVALLTALKALVRDYETPKDRLLNREMQTELRSHMHFINAFRSQSVSMRNAFASLIHMVSHLPPSIPDSQAKKRIISHIDCFVLERLVMADEAIVASAQNKIENGDVLLIYARAYAVEKAILEAQRLGKKFRVVVVDSSPKFEGKNTLQSLVESGLKCSYVMLNAVSYVMKEVSKVFLGAAAMTSNGALLNRCGSAVVAAMAHNYGVPLIVCCETCKFSDRAHLDSISLNELCDPDDMIGSESCSSSYKGVLKDWRSMEALRVLSLAYDLTPAEFVSMVITEIGCIPATSVPVVLRELYHKNL